MTPIDSAYTASENEPQSDQARLRLYERILDSELFLLLENEVKGETVTPALFPVEDQNYALVFDREERLAEFAEKTVPFVALSGRNIIGMLAGQNIGLGVNLAVAPSSTLLPSNVVDWMQDMSAEAPQEEEAIPEEVFPPSSLPEQVISQIDQKLTTMAGLADAAYLCEVSYKNGAKAAMLAFVNARVDAEQSMARAIGETLVFSGIEAGSLDVMFFDASDPICLKLAKLGLRFDLPKLEQKVVEISAPGSDPEKPPILR